MEHPEKWTRWLLASGIASGILFFSLAAIQIPFRPGFDISLHPISMLALGEGGLVQVVNFLATGLLVILSAVGIRKFLKREQEGKSASLLIVVHGLGLIIAGVFTADSAFGFPPGTPEGAPTSMSTHSVLHVVGQFVALVALTAACFVFARGFFSRRRFGLGIYSIATGVVAPLIIIVMSNVFPDQASINAAVATGVTFGWLAVISARFMVWLEKSDDLQSLSR